MGRFKQLGRLILICSKSVTYWRCDSSCFLFVSQEPFVCFPSVNDAFVPTHFPRRIFASSK